MELIEHSKIKYDNSIVIASLPDMGSVGGLVSNFFADNMEETTHIATIISIEKPWVSYSKGKVELVSDEYKIYFSHKYNSIIFTGNTQPKESSELYSLCHVLLKYLTSHGSVRIIYSAGGYLKQQTLTQSPAVCGVVNNDNLIPLLNDLSIDLVGSEISNITWFNGLILGLASKYGISGIGLFGEIAETDIAQPLAAKSIVRAICKLEKFFLDTRLLDENYENILNEKYLKRER